ncbi:hypothetical protein Mpsy_2308 [Methanolobus psychrophilus R15]|nr:hypothetical protein Mpsy_2308 [Methanolobus psychrophilus R15]
MLYTTIITVNLAHVEPAQMDKLQPMPFRRVFSANVGQIRKMNGWE